jgi:putative transcriptional regulator
MGVDLWTFFLSRTDHGREVSPPARKGRLLVAAPTLEDPNFARSVVLLLACDDDGALGIVLNRPGTLSVAEIAPSWSAHASAPSVLFLGGPVQPSAAICIGRPRPPSDDSPGSSPGRDPALGYSPLTRLLGTVDLHKEPAELEVELVGLRVFKGYAGWGPGQLEEEVDEHAWVVVEGEPDDVLTSDPSSLWERVLHRQGGWLAVLARHPVDPSLN